MTDTETTHELRYAADLTAADIDNALSFLRHRIETEAYDKGDTPNSRIARGLLRLLDKASSTARYQLVRLTENNFHTYIQQLESQYELCHAWNMLHDALSPWQDEDGYDAARWRPAYHYDAQHEDSARKVREQTHTATQSATTEA